MSLAENELIISVLCGDLRPVGDVENREQWQLVAGVRGFT